jgi:threonine dehydrogenase-like Zn-dependent dehydrogenase
MRLDEVASPEPGTGEALLKVLTMQPSFTEVVGLHGSGMGSAQIDHVLASGPAQLFGHEFSAQVLSVRSPARGIRHGDRVTSLGRIPCGECDECKAGRPQYCIRGDVIGMTRPGCFAELVAIPTRGLARIPPSLSDGEAATLQPLASLLGAFEAVAPGSSLRESTVAVLGLGVMGLLAVQLARARGATSVVGASTRKAAVAACRNLGIAAYHLPSAVEDLRKFEQRCQAVIDCSGMSSLPGIGVGTNAYAFNLCRPGGSVVQVAILQEPLTVDTSVMRAKGLQYVLPRFSTHRDLSRAAAMAAAGQVRVAPLITRTLIGIEELPRAFEWIRNRSDGAVGLAQVVVSTRSDPSLSD